jgi:membrane-associated phospholipid phosphatase
MAFALIYGAEHYVVDIVAGWVYAIAAYALVTAVARRLAQSGSSA